MPVVDMELSGFSFKRDHEDWIGPIEISMEKPGSCVVLTGINAGGKSLALRTLEKFTKLLAEPSSIAKGEFETLARVAGIEEISATYSYYFPDIDDFYFVYVADNERLLSASGTPSNNGMVEEDDFYYSMKHSIETRFTKDGGFTRRFGLHLKAEFEYFDEHDEPDVHGLNEQMFLKWEKVFDDPIKLAKDRMFSYGPEGFESELLDKFGIKVEPHGFDDHYYWDPNKKYHFVVNKAIMLQVDEAYRVSPETIEKLRPFNENANAKKSGKRWINKRLKTAFEKCKKDFEKKWSDEYRQKSASQKRQMDKLSEDIDRFGESKRSQTEYEAIVKRLEDLKERQKLLGNSEGEYFDAEEPKEEFATFLYPNRKTKYYVDEEGNLVIPDKNDLDTERHDTKQFNWVSKPEIPTVGMRIPTAEILHGSPADPPVNPELETGDIEEICARLMEYCPQLLLKFDPDFLFWIIVSNFIDFPDDPSPSYYSSGQRRMISMIEAVMNSESGTAFLVDEPELSLHIDWQRRFIDQIGVFGRRLVIATHSPDIIYNHTEKVVEVPPNKEV